VNGMTDGTYCLAAWSTKSRYSLMMTRGLPSTRGRQEGSHNGQCLSDPNNDMMHSSMDT